MHHSSAISSRFRPKILDLERADRSIPSLFSRPIMTQVLVGREKCFGKEATYVFAAFFVTNYGNCFFAGREVLREKGF